MPHKVINVNPQTGEPVHSPASSPSKQVTAVVGVIGAMLFVSTILSAVSLYMALIVPIEMCDVETVCSVGVGAEGPVGVRGPTGQTGPAGSKGATGAAGPPGVGGVRGSPGAAGSVGATGLTGPAGAAGMPGAAGATGPVGATGAAGATGDVGATGATGGDGVQGPFGSQGATGVAGAAGVVGATGATGPAGPVGATGLAGTDGATGATGPVGATGDPGVAGATGPAGPPGASGTAGSRVFSKWKGSGNQAVTAGGVVKFDVVMVDTANEFVASSGILTCGFTATYHLLYTVQSDTTDTGYLEIQHNGATVSRHFVPTNSFPIAFGYMLECTVGDTIHLIVDSDMTFRDDDQTTITAYTLP